MSTTAVVNNATANVLSSNLRIATFAIALFDFLQTMPAEYRLYKRQWDNRRVSFICFSFIIVRYVSVICLLLNGVGFYSTHFTLEACKKFYLAPLFTKLVAGLACQAIIFARTYAISRTKWTLITLWVITILILPVQVFGNTYKRKAVVGTGFEAGNCQAKTSIGDFVSSPYYYLSSMIFDIVACSIASYSLLCRSSVNGNIGLFAKKVLKHGVLFAVGASITNFIVFLALMNVPVLKNLGAFLSVAVTMILAQHLVLATAGTAGSSIDDSSQNISARERSLSRDAKGRRTTMIGGISLSTRARSASKGPVDSRIDRVELGGIRIHTETEIHRTRKTAEGASLELVQVKMDDRKSPTKSADSSTDDFIMMPRQIQKESGYYDASRYV